MFHPPKNPLNDPDVDGNTMAWMADSDRERKDDGDEPGFNEDSIDEAEYKCDDR